METTRYWMWPRRQLSGMPLPSAATGVSWEEQAFAEDSADHLGGCVWPPRSYSCNFCRREFRSAQALGGHMNVHRRDRAMIQQSSTSSCENLDQDHHHHHLSITSSCTLLGKQYPPPQVSTLMYNTNTNTNPNPNLGVTATTLSPSRVSAALITQKDQNESKKTLLITPSQPLTDLIPIRPLLTSPELMLGRDNWMLAGTRVSRNPIEDDEEEPINRKRRRVDPVFPVLMKSASADQKLVQSEVMIKLKPTLVEELDLELRLGDPPKVKQLEQ